jgi:hypothetical protein
MVGEKSDDSGEEREGGEPVPESFLAKDFHAINREGMLAELTRCTQ